LPDIPAAIPECPQTGCQAPDQFGILPLQGPSEGVAHIFVVAFESIQPDGLLRAPQTPSTLFGDVPEHRSMATADRVLLALFTQRRARSRAGDHRSACRFR